IATNRVADLTRVRKKDLRHHRATWIPSPMLRGPGFFSGDRSSGKRLELGKRFFKRIEILNASPVREPALPRMNPRRDLPHLKKANNLLVRERAELRLIKVEVPVLLGRRFHDRFGNAFRVLRDLLALRGLARDLS